MCQSGLRKLYFYNNSSVYSIVFVTKTVIGWICNTPNSKSLERAWSRGIVDRTKEYSFVLPTMPRLHARSRLLELGVLHKPFVCHLAPFSLLNTSYCMTFSELVSLVMEPWKVKSSTILSTYFSLTPFVK